MSRQLCFFAGKTKTIRQLSTEKPSVYTWIIVELPKSSSAALPLYVASMWLISEETKGKIVIECGKSKIIPLHSFLFFLPPFAFLSISLRPSLSFSVRIKTLPSFREDPPFSISYVLGLHGKVGQELREELLHHKPITVLSLTYTLSSDHFPRLLSQEEPQKSPHPLFFSIPPLFLSFPPIFRHFLGNLRPQLHTHFPSPRPLSNNFSFVVIFHPLNLPLCHRQ